VALLAERGDERIGACGFPRSHRGATAIELLGRELMETKEPARARGGGVLLLFSDFLAPLSDWERRLQACQPGPHGGALIMIADPAEEDFPYEGRVLLREPGSQRETLLGKAESAKAVYQERLRRHRLGVQTLAGRFGLLALRHRTDHSPAPVLAALLTALSPERG